MRINYESVFIEDPLKHFDLGGLRIIGSHLKIQFNDNNLHILKIVELLFNKKQ